jgi:hypothetical protein
MAVAKSIIEVPIVGGVDQSADALATARPITLENVVERKTGALSRRYGYRAASTINVRRGGGVPPQARALATCGDALVRISDAGYVDVYKKIGSASDWIAQGQASEALADTVTVAAIRDDVAGLGYWTDPAIASAGGMTWVAYTVASASSMSVRLDVVDDATGERVFHAPLETVALPGDLLLAPRVVALGNTVLIAWYKFTTGTVRGVFADATAMTFGGIGTVATIGLPYFDVGVVDSTHWVVGFVNAGNNVRCESVNTAFAGTGGVTLMGGEVAGDIRAVSVRAIPGETIWVAWARNTGGTYYVKAGTAKTDLSGIDGGAGTIATAIGADVLNIGIERLSSTRAILAWTRRDAGVYWNEASKAGAAVGTQHLTLDAFLLSRPLALSGTRAYACVQNVHGTHGTQFLVDLSAQTTLPALVTARMVGVATPRRLKPIRNPGPAGAWSTSRYPRGNVSDFAGGASAYRVAVPMAQDDASAHVAVTRWRFDALCERTTCEANGLLLISGGVPHAWDGASCFEVDFAYEPDIDQCAAFTSSNAGGSMTGGATYGYMFVFSHVDARGNRHQSAPSSVRSITLGAAHNRVVAAYPNLHITNRFRAATSDANNVFVDVYRTEADGQTFFYHSSFANAETLGGVAFTDTTGDATLRLSSQYTTEAVAQTIPPSAAVVAWWKGAVVLGATDDGSLYFSKPALPGEGVGFSGALTQAPFDGGPVVDVASLDGALVVGKASSIWRIDGEPPADDGSSSLTSPVRVPASYGFATSTGTMLLPDGLAFMSERGLALLDRGFTASLFGAGVVTAVPPGTVFAGRAVVPAQQIARWVPRLGTAAVTLDLYHSRLRQAPQWTVDRLDTLGDAPCGACVWKGAFYWVAATGELYSEDPTIFYDTDGTTTVLPRVDVQIAYAAPAGRQGWARLFSASVLAERRTAVGATLTISSDVTSHARSWTDAEVAALPDQPHATMRIGAGTTPGAGKAQWYTIRIQDAAPTAGALGTGEGMLWRSVALEVGVLPGLSRRAPRARK